MVISIIALLIGILLPALASAKKAAQASVCMNHMRQIGIGMQVYTDLYNSYYPPVHGNHYTSPLPPKQEWWEMLEKVTPEFSRTVMISPADPFANKPNASGRLIVSYIINGMFAFSKRRDDVLKPSEKIVVSTRADTGNILEHQGYPAFKAQPFWQNDIHHQRYPAGSNYLYVDSHVKLQKFESTLGDGTDEQDQHYLTEFNPPRPR